MTQPATDWGEGLGITCEAAAAITQFSAVVLSAGTNGYPVATMTSATTNVCGGICQDTATAAGQLVTVRVQGTSLARAGGTVAPGVYVGPTTGTGVLVSGGTDRVGISLNHENVASGDIFPIVIVQSDNA